MQRLKVESERGPYSIIAESGAVSRLAKLIEDAGLTRPRTVVSNTTVAPLWGQPAAASLETSLIELADGEEHKRWPTVEGLLGQWLAAGLHRGDTVAAVGGGVLTDTVGFAAAVYLRGIDWVAVPTTLLAMVDASVGGKTGVNLEQGKNLVGAFWPPRLVVIDVETLSTLPERELRAGMAEVIKTAWIGDHELLSLIPSSVDALSSELWQELVMRCVAVKARVVSEDEREAGKEGRPQPRPHPRPRPRGRDRLHTFFTRRSGGLGPAGGGTGSDGVTACSRATGEEAISAAVATLGPLPSLAEIDPETVGSYIGHDKKKTADGIGWVLPTDKGVALDQRVVAEEALEVLQNLKKSSI